MTNYIKKASTWLNDSKKEFVLNIPDLNESISFNFGNDSIGSNVKEQVEKLSKIFVDELPSNFIAIATDDGGNILVANENNEHVYYYDYNYNFTHLDKTLPEPDIFDIMNAYNSYLVFNNYNDLFQNLI